HPAQFNLFRSRRGRQVLVQLFRIRLSDVSVGQRPHCQALLAPERTFDLQLVSDMESPFRLGRLPVALDLSVLTRLLRLGSRPKEAGDVEPDVQTHAISRLRVLTHSYASCRSSAPLRA